MAYLGSYRYYNYPRMPYVIKLVNLKIYKGEIKYLKFAELAYLGKAINSIHLLSNIELKIYI